MSHARDKTKKHRSLFLYRAQKLTISPISIYKHYAFDIADPSSLQDACHMNFVIDLAHRGVSVAQWLEHRNAESEGLRFDTSWGLRIFSLSHARDKTKKHLSLYTIIATILLSIVLQVGHILLGPTEGRHCEC